MQEFGSLGKIVLADYEVVIATTSKQNNQLLMQKFKTVIKEQLKDRMLVVSNDDGRVTTTSFAEYVALKMFMMRFFSTHTS